MGFYRALTDAKVGGDDLAGRSGQHKLHYLTLPIGKIGDVVMGRRANGGEFA